MSAFRCFYHISVLFLLAPPIFAATNLYTSTGRGADLGGEVRQRGDVMAIDRGGARELAAGELHAVTGVAREADRDAIKLLDRGRRMLFGFCCHARAGSWFAARPTIPWAALDPV